MSEAEEIAETFAAASVTNEAICILGLGKLAVSRSQQPNKTAQNCLR